MDKDVLSHAEKEGLTQEKKELEHTLESIEKDKYGTGTKSDGINKEFIRGQIKHLDKAINEGTAGCLSTSEKSKINKYARGLEEKIKEGMCTRNEMQSPHLNPGSVRKHYEWNKKNSETIRRWKQCQRRLNPSDPTSSNIERLRRR